MAVADPVVAAALERLNRIDPEIHAFVEEPARSSRLAASPAIDGPLRQVVVGVKDLYRVDGLPTRVGSRLPPELFEGYESAVVQGLKRSGAVVLGKTALDEFAYCEPPPTKNPRDLRRTPGGSSGGSAAAVAGGICDLAVGSQTLQSVIVPAAYCGVVGYTITRGRLRFDGVPLSTSMDTVGFLAPSAAEIRIAAATLVPAWDEPDTSSPPVLGTLEPWGTPALSVEGWQAHAAHLEIIRGGGFEMRRTIVPWNDPEQHRTWGGCIGDLLHAEMALAHAPWFDQFEHLYGKRTAQAIRWGREITAERLEECRIAQPSFAEQLQEIASVAGIDCWIGPSAHGAAPIGYQNTGDTTMTGFWSYAGFPAVSLPVFDGPEGMPLGVQLIATPGDDERLLGWAAHIESALKR